MGDGQRHHPGGEHQVVGPPFRFIADLGDLRNSLGLLSPGNSGLPASPHYDDQIEAWFSGGYHPMLFAREDVERGVARRWLLHLASRNSGTGGRMRVKLAYGKTGLWIDLPDAWNTTVVEPRFVPGVPDPVRALEPALRQPIGAPALRDLVAPDHRVGIVFSDITRPTPHRLILPAVLRELTEQARVPRENITLFNALGTHRPNTDAELRGMIGDDLVDGCRVVQNNAFDPETQVSLGLTARGHEIWMNRDIMACDVRILTGFIEPHLFAGFSGGGKALMPGMAGLRTVLGNHDASMLADPNAIWGITQGNPTWEEVMEVARAVGERILGQRDP